MSEIREIKIGLVSISDRASRNEYQDLGLPNLKDWLLKTIVSPWCSVEKLIPDEQELIAKTLIELVDEYNCDLILTTGGTGPAKRDVTPEATLSIGDKELPGFGEQMRQISLNFVPTAILSRQTAVVRNSSLIINLPGQPKAIRETLEGLRDSEGKNLVKGIFSAVPYGLELIGGPLLMLDDKICKAYRPKK
ncbi:MAG: molybdopterin adenylyltransferase [Betaproteobacteria bacterium TMED100]|nr:MAG: molybdopterin adenylyltransferase [Betaproteobacteria bacterium TMED100]|tara:strand:- start:2716 stop:3291 length:576 start_codon:yes stop_codon:yes gene_type:complete